MKTRTRVVAGAVCLLIAASSLMATPAQANEPDLLICSTAKGCIPLYLADEISNAGKREMEKKIAQAELIYDGVERTREGAARGAEEMMCGYNPATC